MLPKTSNIALKPQSEKAIMKYLNTQDADFQAELQALLAFETAQDPKIDQIVADICADVQQRGDAAVIEYTNRFDGTAAQSIHDLTLSQEALKNAFERLPEAVQQALKTSAARVESYHQRQKLESWSYTDEDGTLLGQQITALDRVGIYVPGGKAAYPSSVIMNAMPAHVAGVQEIIMVVPTPKGERNDIVLAAAYVAGVTKVFTIGGAQAVAALAYGTETIPSVDKITGPGNRFVAAAKRAVFGQVGIDMIAGPSEILVYAEGQNNAQWLAMDLLSQAEHDTVAQAIFITPDEQLLNEVEQAIEEHLANLPKAEIARTSIKNRGALILVQDRQEAIDLINQVAPEHLELCLDEAEQMAEQIRHAGAIFMGRYTPEAIGDYCAGPNHVLPTSGTARFSSPLGVYDFQKRSSLIMCSQQGVKTLAKTADILAQEENLDAHARSARYRYQ